MPECISVLISAYLHYENRVSHVITKTSPWSDKLRIGKLAAEAFLTSRLRLVNFNRRTKTVWSRVNDCTLEFTETDLTKH